MPESKSNQHGVGFIGLVSECLLSHILAFTGDNLFIITDMGSWMAFNLRRCLSKSIQLFVYDLDAGVCERLRREAESIGLGPVCTCVSSREVAVQSVRKEKYSVESTLKRFGLQDVIFTIVPEGRHVEDVFLNGSTGILTGPVDDKTFVDSSTIDPATSIEVGKAVLRKSPTARFYDAPVSGGVSGAQAASLTFLVGTSEDDAYFRDCLRPLLQMMGKNMFCVGGPGQGLVAKLCNNYLSGTCAIATSEAMNIGIRHGIDPKLLSDIFDKSTGGNWQNGISSHFVNECICTEPSLQQT